MSLLPVPGEGRRCYLHLPGVQGRSSLRVLAGQRRLLHHRLCSGTIASCTHAIRGSDCPVACPSLRITFPSASGRATSRQTSTARGRCRRRGPRAGPGSRCSNSRQQFGRPPPSEFGTEWRGPAKVVGDHGPALLVGNVRYGGRREGTTPNGAIELVPYDAASYSAELPRGWTMTENELQRPSESESRWSGDTGLSDYVLIDLHTPTHLAPEQDAEPVHKTLEESRSYHEISYEPGDLAGRNSWMWVSTMKEASGSTTSSKRAPTP